MGMVNVSKSVAQPGADAGTGVPDQEGIREEPGRDQERGIGTTISHQEAAGGIRKALESGSGTMVMSQVLGNYG